MTILNQRRRWCGLFALASLGLLGWLVWSDLVVSGKLQSTYAFTQPSPYILSLAPKDRLGDFHWAKEDRRWQSIIDDPIYFDLRLPRQFSAVTFSVIYRANAQDVVRLGAFYNKDHYQYQLRDFDSVSDIGDGWRLGTVTFDLTDKRFAFQKYQFMISVPTLRGSGRTVDFARIDMTATRPPLTVSRLWHKLQSIVW